ncbi:permease-like cell division protein FtsX [Amycolatopsis sp. NPDC059020]|uniref:permease-like cell division protein FtsX n=1 Tax=Amycolatopsis sp. NPDC059020 TaxID=3346703 RepID=UPI003672CD3E
MSGRSHTVRRSPPVTYGRLVARRLLLTLLAVLALAGCGSTVEGAAQPQPETEVSAFLGKAATPEVVAAMQRRAAKTQSVLAVRYSAGQQAYERYQRLTAGKPGYGPPLTSDSVTGALVVRVANASAADAVKQALTSLPGVTQVLPCWAP